VSPLCTPTPTLPHISLMLSFNQKLIKFSLIYTGFNFENGLLESVVDNSLCRRPVLKLVYQITSLDTYCAIINTNNRMIDVDGNTIITNNDCLNKQEDNTHLISASSSNNITLQCIFSNVSVTKCPIQSAGGSYTINCQKNSVVCSFTSQTPVQYYFINLSHNSNCETMGNTNVVSFFTEFTYTCVPNDHFLIYFDPNCLVNQAIVWCQVISEQ